MLKIGAASGGVGQTYEDLVLVASSFKTTQDAGIGEKISLVPKGKLKIAQRTSNSAFKAQKRLHAQTRRRRRASHIAQASHRIDSPAQPLVGPQCSTQRRRRRRAWTVKLNFSSSTSTCRWRSRNARCALALRVVLCVALSKAAAVSSVYGSQEGEGGEVGGGKRPQRALDTALVERVMRCGTRHAELRATGWDGADDVRLDVTITLHIGRCETVQREKQPGAALAVPAHVVQYAAVQRGPTARFSKGALRNMYVVIVGAVTRQEIVAGIRRRVLAA
ncbi:hypothetical protein B0H19DRAFT_1241611 [Mycena capillaripes]|nr:hypothetical protein B0H19DRAFT_1241611 [Mycena capillaripes]